MTCRSQLHRVAASFFALVLVYCIGMHVDVQGQVAGGTITGTLADSSGRVIPNANVSITNVATGINRNVTTNEDGLYIAPNLLPASYELTFNASGFKTDVRRGIELTVGATVTLNMTRSVGGARETILVQSEAPAVQLIRSEKIKAADVELVEVGTNHNMVNTLVHHRPKNNLQAKFSMEFCMAILLLEDKAGLGEFTDAIVSRPDVQQMIERIRFYTDPEAEKAGYDKMTTILRIHLKDGRVITGRADFGKGSPANPMNYDEVAEKFQGCADFAQWPADRAKKIIEVVRDLEELDDMRTLTALCGG